jgi:hypothetical protein
MKRLMKNKTVEDLLIMTKPKPKVEEEEKPPGEIREEFDNRMNYSRSATITSRKETRRLL